MRLQHVTVFMVMIVVFMVVSQVQANVVGERTSIDVGGLMFYMRLAPAATIPTGRDDSGRATIHNPFWIAETPVTYEQWHIVWEWALANGYSFANVGREGSHGNMGQAPTSKRNEPVTMVSWRDSVVWCNALSEMLGLQAVYTYQGIVIKDSNDVQSCDNAIQEYNNGFRLPTSSEWELAARYQGDDSSHGAIALDSRYWTSGSYGSGATGPAWNPTDEIATQEVAWYAANSCGSTREVGLKRPNVLGLYDMSGNVWERCFTIIESQGVFRGGSWNRSASGIRVGTEGLSDPDHTTDSCGFRLAKELLQSNFQ